MPNGRILILDTLKIEMKLQRMAYQIWEDNSSISELVMIGIADNGIVMAKMLQAKLEAISPIKVNLISLSFDKKNPLKNLSSIDEDLDGKSVVLVDDVSNSGKVMMYALRPILAYSPAKISMAVLVDRTHKKFPVNPDIVGHSLSTTLKENITVESDGKSLTGVYLD